jgi:hypothetical protein
MNDLSPSDFAGLEYSHTQRADERHWSEQAADDAGVYCTPTQDALLLLLLTGFVVLLGLFGYYASDIFSTISFLFLKVMP